MTEDEPVEPVDRIELRGLRVMGVHGVTAEERKQAQPFEVDLHVEMDLRRPGRSDNLADTVDYGAVSDAAAAAVAGPAAHLLEHLAERIALAALDAAPSAQAVRLTIRKLRPPVPYDLASAAVTIRRVRPTPES